MDQRREKTAQKDGHVKKIVIFLNFPTETWQIVAPSLKVRFKSNRRKRNKMQCINLHQEIHFEKRQRHLWDFLPSPT